MIKFFFFLFCARGSFPKGRGSGVQCFSDRNGSVCYQRIQTDAPHWQSGSSEQFRRHQLLWVITFQTHTLFINLNRFSRWVEIFPYVVMTTDVFTHETHFGFIEHICFPIRILPVIHDPFHSHAVTCIWVTGRDLAWCQILSANMWTLLFSRRTVDTAQKRRLDLLPIECMGLLEIIDWLNVKNVGDN